MGSTQTAANIVSIWTAPTASWRGWAAQGVNQANDLLIEKPKAAAQAAAKKVEDTTNALLQQADSRRKKEESASAATAAANAARAKQRSETAGAVDSTILTSALGVPGGPATGGKTLLGT